MRVLLDCQDYGGNVGWSFWRLLRELGHQVWCVNEDDNFGSYLTFSVTKGSKRLRGVLSACRRFNHDLCRLAHLFP